MAGKPKAKGRKLQVNKQTAKDLSVSDKKAKTVKGGRIATGPLGCTSSDATKTCKCC